MGDLQKVVPPRLVVHAAIVLALLVSSCANSDDGAESDAAAGSTSSLSDSSGIAGAETQLPEPVQQLDIDATEYSFEISPDPSGGLEPGWTLLKFHNIGVEPHQVMFAQIKDGVDMAELAAAGANDSSGAGAIEFVDMVGGVSYIGENQDTTALVNLGEGTVMAMCYVPDAQGVAHALMGMSTALTVSAPDDATSQDALSTDETVLGTIELSEDGYQVPTDLGTGWYRVTNTDSALHELSLLRLGESIDEQQAAVLVEDLAANKTPQVELEAVGGMGAISAGFDGYLYLDLEPGAYLAVDFMPDPGEPRPHMLDGYYDMFDVQT